VYFDILHASTWGALLMFVALQASEKMTPDSQKSTLDQAKETVTGAGDRMASAAQPGESARRDPPSCDHC